MTVRLTIVHGDIETPEEAESLSAVHASLVSATSWLRTVGTNDTTTYEVDGPVPRDALVMARACAELYYPHWRVTVE